MESIFKRIGRHIATGQVGPKTVIRGASALAEWAKSYDIQKSDLTATGIEHDYISIHGLNKYKYNYLVKKGSHNYGLFEVIEFPKDSHLQVDANYLDYERIPEHLDRQTSAIAEFVGPTTEYLNGAKLPNNGFYYKGDANLNVPFMDTNPSWKQGIRRGAVLIDKSGVTHILTDAQKWDVVNSNYANCDVMFGTSTYFTSADSNNDKRLFQELDRDRVSYLVQFVDEKNEKRFCYVHISTFVSRKIAKTSIDQHMRRIKARSYIACELELFGAGCTAKNGSQTKDITTIPPLMSRQDHYTIVPGAEAKGTNIKPPTRSRT